MPSPAPDSRQPTTKAQEYFRGLPHPFMNMHPDRLILVYNADDGFFNALMDTAHKVFSPETYACSLCRFTYGIRGMLLPWKKYVEGLGFPAVFLHRNEFRRDFPDIAVDLPVILAEYQGEQTVLVSAAEISAAGDLDGLIKAVRDKLAVLDEA